MSARRKAANAANYRPSNRPVASNALFKRDSPNHNPTQKEPADRPWRDTTRARLKTAECEMRQLAKTRSSAKDEGNSEQTRYSFKGATRRNR